MSEYSIAGFIEHLAGMAERVVLAEHHALVKAAKIVEVEAKAEIGHYQTAIGGFDAWQQLADQTLEYHASMGVGDTPLIVTGELYGTIGREIDGLEAVIGSTSDIMVYQELGTADIPPRPVLGPALLRKERDVVRLLGDYTVTALLSGSEFSHLPRPEYDSGD